MSEGVPNKYEGSIDLRLPTFMHLTIELVDQLTERVVVC